MEDEEKRHLRTKHIVGIKRFEAVPLLRCALIVSLLGTLLLMAANLMPYGTPYYIYISRTLYLTAHLLLAAGSSLLLWAVVEEPDRMLRAAVLLNIIYHLSAAVGSVVAYRYGFYYLTLTFWCLRSLAGTFVAVDFIFFGDARLRLAGVLMVLTYFTGCPHHLGFLGNMQWPLSKLSAICMYIQLYRCAARIYLPRKKKADPLDTPNNKKE